jgi:hypothetical protein
MNNPWINEDNVHLWQNCETPDCENRACTVLDSVWCFPCTMRVRKMSPEDGRRLIKQRREETFGVGCDA